MIIKNLDQPPRRLIRPLVINLQTALVRDNGRPDVLMRQTLAELLSFAQQTDRAIRLDAAHEMDVASRDWQPLRQRTDLLTQQQPAWRATLGLGWSLTAERLRLVLACIPRDELWTAANNFITVDFDDLLICDRTLCELVSNLIILTLSEPV